MTRPGPAPWAENDVYVGGPDVGSNTKTSPLALHREDGYYRTRRPAPDILNHQLNRLGLLQSEVARMRAKNLVSTDGTAGAAANTMAGWCYDQLNDICTFLFHNAAGAALAATESIGGEIWPAQVAVFPAGVGVFDTVDGAADDVGNRHVIGDGVGAGLTDIIRASAHGGAWGAVGAGGAGLHWQAIGCDRNTAAGAQALFLIGDDANVQVGPAAQPVVYGFGAGPAYGVVAGFGAATLPAGVGVGEEVYFIGHTNHPVGALGPDDPGNPSWLVLTTTQSVVSADGAAWTTAAHGFLGAVMAPRVAAYSRTSGRWVVALQGAAAGNIEYSDDNGTNWTLVAGAFNAVTAFPQIVCDGYGTFVVGEAGIAGGADTQFFVSVDEGLTWESVVYPVDPNGDEFVLGAQVDASLNVDDAPTWSQAIHHGVQRAAPSLSVQRSQRT